MNALALDTNLLVLLLVGSVSEDAIGRHKRTQAYDVAAFRMLQSYANQARPLVTTPHVLTEASNLIRQCGDPLRTSIGQIFAAFVKQAEEISHTARLIVMRPEHGRLGLSDAGMLEAQSQGVILMTDDNGLYLASLAAGHRAINFAHEWEKTS